MSSTSCIRLSSTLSSPEKRGLENEYFSFLMDFSKKFLEEKHSLNVILIKANTFETYHQHMILKNTRPSRIYTQKITSCWMNQFSQYKDSVRINSGYLQLTRRMIVSFFISIFQVSRSSCLDKMLKKLQKI